MERRLYRSRGNRMIFGVCGGLGYYLNIDPTVIRVVAALTLLLGLTGLLVYLVLAIVIPAEP